MSDNRGYSSHFQCGFGANQEALQLTGFEALLGITILAMLMFTLSNRISRS